MRGIPSFLLFISVFPAIYYGSRAHFMLPFLNIIKEYLTTRLIIMHAYVLIKIYNKYKHVVNCIVTRRTLDARLTGHTYVR